MLFWCKNFDNSLILLSYLKSWKFYFNFRVILENSSDGPLSVWDFLCHRNTHQHISGGICLQECEICTETQVSTGT